MIIVDPVTMIHYNDPREIAAGSRQLVKTCLSVAKNSECTICLVNHFNKGGETMQGGSSFSDHSDVVLEFKALPEPEEHKVAVDGFKSFHEVEMVNRIIYVSKARQGNLCWHKIGYEFDPHSLECIEKGILRK